MVTVESLPDHLVGIGERFALWRWVALRGAGMPVDWLAELSRPGLAELAEPEFTAALADIGRRLRAIAATATFREAVTWQNRRALHTGVDVLLASPERRSSKYRQKEALIAGYLQRYCAKNDTIGFFGPVGWARISDGPPITVTPGPGLVAERTTYFEGWCIEQVAEVLARDERLLPWLAPRLLPFLRVTGNTLHAPLASPVALRAEEAVVLASCDGQRPAREIATDLVRKQPELFADEESVYAVLRKLRTARRIVWTLEAPADDPHPERTLRAIVGAVEPGRSRRHAEQVLDALVALRDRVATAAGEPDRLDEALASLEQYFAELTGSAPTRRHGQLYAGRTLVYEDCRRDIEVQIGPRLLDALAPPLELLLMSARWFTERAIDLYRQSIIALHERLAARFGPRVPLENLWLYAQDLLFRDGGDNFDRLAAEVRQRWSTVLAWQPGRARAYAVADLRDSVARAFATSTTTQGITRYCCPDVMIAAESTEAINAGRCQFVLGELHAGFNTLTSAFFARHHPAPAELTRAVETDLPQPQIIAVFSREVPSRMMRGLVSPRDIRIVYAQDSCGVPSEVAVPISALVAERTDAGLQISTRDGRLSFESMRFFGELVMVRAHRAFGVLPAADHTPRLSFDALVVEREKWRMPASMLSFAWMTDERDRFRAASQWRESRGMPRYVFAKTSRDAKPVYVDFESPVFVDLLSRTVRKAASAGESVTISEMLPTPDQTWLTDRQGRRYTSELRLVAIGRP